MIYKEKLYKNALNAIEQIYIESQYNSEVDLYRSFDIINSINSAQMSSKEWLVKNLSEVLKDEFNLRDGKIRDILIMGAWYGISGFLLRECVNPDCKIWNIDSDPGCEIIGNSLQQDIKELENNFFITSDALEYYFDRPDAYQIIINTSCEHMDQEDIDMVINIKPPNTIICFQSNNYHDEPEHINTHTSLEEFEKSLNLVRTFWSGVLKPTDADYERYMVIGI